MTAHVYEWPCIYDHGHLEPNSLLATEPMEGDECVCTCKLSVSKCCRYCQIVQHCLSKVRKDLGVKITSCFTHTHTAQTDLEFLEWDIAPNEQDPKI